jgi:hypothetical protein
MKLPDSPIRKVKQCPRCNRVLVKFFDPKHNTSYSYEEWRQIVHDGSKALDRLLQMHDPKFFA